MLPPTGWVKTSGRASGFRRQAFVVGIRPGSPGLRAEQCEIRGARSSPPVRVSPAPGQADIERSGSDHGPSVVTCPDNARVSSTAARWLRGQLQWGELAMTGRRDTTNIRSSYWSASVCARRYHAHAAQTVGEHGSLVERMRLSYSRQAGTAARVLFPIGVPRAYASAAGIQTFADWFRELDLESRSSSRPPISTRSRPSDISSSSRPVLAAIFQSRPARRPAGGASRLPG